MSRRIITMQRQLRELGRIRSGYSEPYTKDGKELRRAVRSETFILTAVTRDNLDIAAELWGGTVEQWQPQGSGPEVWRVITRAPAIDAILPPGDPLSQAYEFWNKGGAVRRCDGERDEKSNGPCVCRAQFGEAWFERRKTEVCQPYTRLNVFLELSDFGYWRIETKSFYAAGEISGAVDLIKARIGPEPAVPIRLRIDPRSKVEAGKTTPYPVIVLELRGVATAQILAGVAPVLSIDGIAHLQPAVAAAPDRAAIESSPAPQQPAAPGRDWKTEMAAATTLDALRALWKQAGGANGMDEETKKAFWAAKDRIDAAAKPAEAAADAEIEPDRDDMWASVLSLAGEREWKTAEVSQRLRDYIGKDVTDANGWEIQGFRDALKNGEVA